MGFHSSGEHPDFTGVWKLIRGESEFGFLPSPQLRMDTIIHQEPVLRIRTRQKDANGDITLDRDFVIGGEPVEIAIRGRARTVRAFWGEAALVITTLSEVSGYMRRIEDRWVIDGGGEWLTIRRLHELPGGPVRQLLRLQRRIARTSVAR